MNMLRNMGVSVVVNVNVVLTGGNAMTISIELTDEEAEYLDYILTTEQDSWEQAIGQRDDAQACYDVCGKVLEALENDNT